MKKIAAIFLCICMLLAAQPGWGGEAGEVELTDEQIEKLTQMYLNIEDIGAYIEMMREYGVDEKTLEEMRIMHKVAREGKLGDYFRGVYVPEDNESKAEDEPLWGGGELELYPAYVAIPVGYSLYLDWSVADGQAIEWRSSNSAVAAVEADGLITAISQGEAVITASLKNKPEVKAYCGVYVVPFIERRENNVVIWEKTPPGVEWTETAKGPALAQKSDEPGNPSWGTGIELPIWPDTGAVVSFKPPAPGSARVKIDKGGVKNAQKKGYDWTIFIDREETTRCDYPGRGYSGAFHTHTYKVTLKATKKGGTTPFGAYFGEAFLYVKGYEYSDYFIEDFLHKNEKTTLWAGELRYGSQESARSPYYANGMLFAVTPDNRAVVSSALSALHDMLYPNSPLDPTYAEGAYETKDLIMKWDYVNSDESKYTARLSVKTLHGTGAGVGQIDIFNILIEDNAVEVSIQHCPDQGPVTFRGGSLTKKLRK